MIIVSVELRSAITGKRTELARMEIANRGDGSPTIANYDVRTLRGRSTTALDERIPQREGTVCAWPKAALHVWCLVSEALRQVGYGRK